MTPASDVPVVSLPAPANRWLWFASLAFGLCVIALRFDEYVVGSVTDDAVYTELARSLSEGRGPAIHLSDCISYSLRQLFPLGYPLILSAVAWVAPTSISALKLLSVAATLATAILYLKLLQPLVSPTGRLVLVTLALVNPWTVAYSNRVLSEAVYASCSLAATIAYVTWRSRPAYSPHAILVAALLGLSASVRTVGLSLIGAVLTDLALRRDWRRFCLLVPALAVAVAPQIWATGGDLISQGYRVQVLEHGDDALARVASVTHHFTAYLKQLPAALVPAFGDRLQAMAAARGLERVYVVATSLLGLCLLSVVALGLWSIPDQSRRGYRVIGIYLLLYAGAMLNFLSGPWGIQLRFLVPVLPFLYLGLLLGAKRLAALMSGSAERLAIAAMVAILPVSVAHNFYRIADPMGSSRSDSGRGFVDYSRGTDWFRANSAPDAVIMASYPLERHIHLGRPTVAWPSSSAIEVLRSVAEKCNVRYLLVAPGHPESPAGLNDTERARLAILRSRPQQFKPVLDSPQQALYIFETVGRLGSESRTGYH